MQSKISQIKCGTMNRELEDWLRERTDRSISPPPEHCLSDVYQPFHGDSLFPGVPVFVKEPPKRRRYPSWPSADPERVIDYREEGWREEYNELDVKRVQFVRETRNEFAEPLSGEDQSQKREAFVELLQLEKSMRQDAKMQAKEIDETFEVEDPSSNQSSNLLAQSLKICTTARQLVEKHGNKALLRNALDAETEKVELNIRPSRFDTPLGEASSNPQHEAYSLLKPIFEAGTCECINLAEEGFRCGVAYFPADAELEQFHEFMRLHFENVESEADSLGNDHALLSYRLMSLRAVLQEYRRYGRAETWHFIDPAEVDDWREKSLNEERRSVENIQLLFYSVEEILSDPTKKNEVWHQQRKGCPVHWSGLHAQLSRIEGDPLQKEDGDPITPQWLQTLVEEFFEPEVLEALRKEAGV